MSATSSHMQQTTGNMQGSMAAPSYAMQGNTFPPASAMQANMAVANSNILAPSHSMQGGSSAASSNMHGNMLAPSRSYTTQEEEISAPSTHTQQSGNFPPLSLQGTANPFSPSLLGLRQTSDHK